MSVPEKRHPLWTKPATSLGDQDELIGSGQLPHLPKADYLDSLLTCFQKSPTPESIFPGKTIPTAMLLGSFL